MRHSPRKISFVLASSDHGALIVSRLDYHKPNPASGYGVGFDILEHSSFEATEIDACLSMLELRRKYAGDGVVAIDCGANIGTHTIDWARCMSGWGSVIAIEAQERIFYALAGNIALNNCLNARAIHAAVSERDGMMEMPSPDYANPASFGSLELRKRPGNEFIGQEVRYEGSSLATVKTLTLDSLNLPRVDLVKIDVEGMELEVLQGAAKTIQKNRPIVLAEAIKVDQLKLKAALEGMGYQVVKMKHNFLAIHTTDPALANIRTRSN
jgi:FkbM family methyltransferase